MKITLEQKEFKFIMYPYSEGGSKTITMAIEGRFRTYRSFLTPYFKMMKQVHQSFLLQDCGL